ncbi:MAG: diguanylate cyclase domain-containing protein [Candidatus Hydrogenedentota bacterium]
MNVSAMMETPQLLKTLLDTLFEGVYIVDRQRRIQYWNRGAERLTGYREAEVAGQCCSDNVLMHVNDQANLLCQNRCPLSATMRDGKERKSNVYLLHKKGYRIPVQLRVAPIHDEEGRVTGAIQSFEDNTAEMAALRQLRESEIPALTCSLTKLANRTYTERVLRRRIEEFNHEGGRLAVLFMAIDGFDGINETHGHKAGDKVLSITARTLANGMRSCDLLGRWGSERFVAILPHLKSSETETLANTLRLMVEKSSYAVPGRTLGVTVSIGAASAQTGDTPDELISRAKELQQKSKHNGQNRVTIG